MTLKKSLLNYWLILLHYREVLHYREFITLLEQNIIIDIFQDIPVVFMTAILTKRLMFKYSCPKCMWLEEQTFMS